MAYVKNYGRLCGAHGCSNFATLVVCNRFDVEYNYFCRRHRRDAERLAAALTNSVNVDESVHRDS